VSDSAYTDRSEKPSQSSEGAPPITTLAGLKKEIHTAIVQYFAPVAALYNVVATTAGLPTVRWQTPFESDQTTGHPAN
jgi:hypothetical protein